GAWTPFFPVPFCPWIHTWTWKRLSGRSFYVRLAWRQARRRRLFAVLGIWRAWRGLRQGRRAVRRRKPHACAAAGTQLAGRRISYCRRGRPATGYRLTDLPAAAPKRRNHGRSSISGLPAGGNTDTAARDPYSRRYDDPVAGEHARDATRDIYSQP